MLVGVVTVAPFGAAAQAGAPPGSFRPRIQWEVRADGLVAPTFGLQAGAGANAPVGYYLRLGASVAAGPRWEGDRAYSSARVEVTSRYLLDPFGETRWGFYGGAGLAARWDGRAHWAGFLLLVGGVEGPEARGWRTAVEVGLGGGARFGVVLRRARRNGR